MKATVVILFAVGLAVLHLQVDARRLLLEEVKAAKADNQQQHAFKPQRGHELDAVDKVASDDVKPNDQTRSSANNNKSSGDDDASNSLGNYTGPSGSSTESHHVYTKDCQPTEVC